MSESTVREKSQEQVKVCVQKQRAYFNEGHTKPLATRVRHLEKLLRLLREHKPQIIEALRQDLNKSETEVYLTEIGLLIEEIRFTMKHLERWAKPKKVKTVKTHIGSKGYRIPEPYGVTLVVSPWNYPIQLALAPLIGALAAGNTVILKPSELTPACSHLLATLINDHFEEGLLYVIEGGVDTSQYLLKERFDYIFFTGSVGVGKIVMEAASKYLTPVTLELGGKSPCIVHKDADLKLAAKRIAQGKLTNAGQTCIAPDYLLLHEDIKSDFIAEYKRIVTSFYGEQPLKNEAYAKVVNERHFQRVKSYLDDGRIIFGGQVDERLEKIEPTLIEPSSEEVPIMREEIFGPVLPVLTYRNIDEVIERVNGGEKPLALYLFTKSSEVEEQIVNNISYGGGCINDTLMHIATPYLPFGGVGESGMGAYHGESSFSTFSHYKSVLKQTTLFDFSFRYPNAKNGLAILKRLFG
ncbi:aldehyde dehydrogenase [Mechercharimyces sp. CAU 1602]|uniref:aldehyde dehydrogenase n=1 Tax=Mechercharimyces sp. CAU 1602 TaxID=2973933 RepID=UPI00216387CB|nr:aldehyde dehydrogenase [Mechercharimyces sp. CAU 1602]MCS1352602.1 aldehyde dehydrogenase [Mechercharimyces sp. CAU 1602]